MSREALYQEIHNLERRITLLISEHAKLKEQLDHKTQEAESLKAKIGSQETKLSNFQNKYNISKIVGGTAVGKEDAGDLSQNEHFWRNLGSWSYCSSLLHRKQSA